MWYLLLCSLCICCIYSEDNPTAIRRLSKRQALTLNKDLTLDNFYSFNSENFDLPFESVFPMGRPLKRGRYLPIVEFVAFWIDDLLSLHVGSIRVRSESVQANFIVNGSIISITDEDFDNESVLVLQALADERPIYKFQWKLVKNAIPDSIISFVEADGNDTAITPAVYKVFKNWEYYGIADVASGSMQYIKNDTILSINGTEFTDKVYLLTKQDCTCSAK